MTRYAEHPVDDDGWTDWIRPAENWKERCCDCGLVHDVQIQVRSNKKPRKGEVSKVFLKFRRNERATAASRRSGRYRDVEGERVTREMVENLRKSGAKVTYRKGG